MPSKADTAIARTIGIDTGKNALHVIGLDEKGAIVLREKVSRTRIAARFVNLPPCFIGIEAGMASHHVARELIALGHEVKQVPPAYSRPFRQGHKNDFRDAHAVAEAAERRSTRCVPIKTDEQLDLQALHRVRSRLISNRTAVINQIRGFLLEHGIPVRQGHHFLRRQLPQLLATRTDVLSPRMIRIIEDLMADWKYLDERIERVTDEIEALARADESCQQLITVPGIGPIISSAMVAAIGNGAAYRKGRDFAAWLGLVPKQMSTGDRTILGRITKRGNRYLRMLFIQGARATAAGLFKVSGTSGLATFESLAALNPLEAPVPPRFLEELRPYRSHTARPLTAHVDDKSKSGGGRKRINVHDDYASLTLRASLLVEEIRRLA